MSDWRIKPGVINLESIGAFGPKGMKPEDRADDFENMQEDHQQQLMAWIEENLEPHKHHLYNPEVSSYGLKRQFEATEPAFTVSLGSMKGAMLTAGFIPIHYGSLNWKFKLSPSVKADRDFKSGR